MTKRQFAFLMLAGIAATIVMVFYYAGVNAVTEQAGEWYRENCLNCFGDEENGELLCAELKGSFEATFSIILAAVPLCSIGAGLAIGAVLYRRFHRI